MRVFHRHLSRRHLVVLSGELLLIFGATMTVAQHYRPGDDLLTTSLKSGAVAAVFLLCMYYNDLYDLTLIRTTREVFIDVLPAVGAAVLLIGLLYLTPHWDAAGDGAFLFNIGAFLTGVLTWRLAFNNIATAQTLGERLLIVGTDAAARAVARQVLAQKDFPYTICGFIDEDPRRIGQSVVNPRVVGTPVDIDWIVSTRGIDRIVVGMGDRRGRLPVHELLRAKLRGVCVEDVNTLYERLTGKLLVEDLRPSSLVFSDGFRTSAFTKQSKRGLDIALAVVGLTVGGPLMVLTAIAVWIETGSPVLYRQERVGYHGRLFTLNKFRSMHKNAERGTPVWARAVDVRVTRVGRLIRKTHLDELPQLWNVLRGDMSFVGPRPERPFFVAQLADRFSFYELRHAVKPGITGWAQVKYRYGASMGDAFEKLRYDLYYVKHVSVLFDLTILFDTVKVVLLGKGAR